MLSGKLPFNDEFLPRLQFSIVNGNYDIQALNDLKISNDAILLVCGMLEVNLNKRLTMEEICCHPWLRIPELE